MSMKQESTALATKQEETGELTVTADSAQIQTEVQGAMIMAKKYPRNEGNAYMNLMQSAKRPTFAAKAVYRFPRGGKEISGPSVKLAREAKRVWGNLWTGFAVVHETPISRKIRAVAWDLETGNREFAEDEFRKLIFRKEGGWIEPDERDLRELTNRRAAILERNCILKLMPPDLIEDAILVAAQTSRDRAAKDPQATRKELLMRLGTLSIPLGQVETRWGHPIAEATPDELAELESILQSIEEGNSRWSEYVVPTEAPEPPKPLADKLQAKAAQQQQAPAKPTPPPATATVPPPPKPAIPTQPVIEVGQYIGKEITDPVVPIETLYSLVDHYLMLTEDPKRKQFLGKNKKMVADLQAEIERRQAST